MDGSGTRWDMKLDRGAIMTMVGSRSDPLHWLVRGADHDTALTGCLDFEQVGIHQENDHRSNKHDHIQNRHNRAKNDAVSRRGFVALPTASGLDEFQRFVAPEHGHWAQDDSKNKEADYAKPKCIVG